MPNESLINTAGLYPAAALLIFGCLLLLALIRLANRNLNPLQEALAGINKIVSQSIASADNTQQIADDRDKRHEKLEQDFIEAAKQMVGVVEQLKQGFDDNTKVLSQHVENGSSTISLLQTLHDDMVLHDQNAITRSDEFRRQIEFMNRERDKVVNEVKETIETSVQELKKTFDEHLIPNEAITTKLQEILNAIERLATKESLELVSS